jgi:hypothetical protein
VTLDGLLQLPVGAEFRERNGQAVVAVIRTEGGLTASATCDSLTLLVDELRTEIFHLNAEKGSFKSEESEIKTVEVNRLTGWQWFQVWTGRICLGLLMVFAVVKGLKRL